MTMTMTMTMTMRTAIRTTTLALLLTSALHATTPTLSPVAQARANGQASGVVNVNTATEAQLMMLPGVGRKLANEIYTYAEAGPRLYDPKAPANSACDHKCHLRSLADLDRVKGVGTAKLQALAPHVTFSGRTTLSVKVKSPARKRTTTVK